MSSRKRIDKINKLHSDYSSNLENIANAQIKLAESQKRLINECLQEYGDIVTQNELINNAKKYHYSTKELEKLEKQFMEWNQDNVNINTVECIISAETFISENSPHNLFNRIGEFVNELGEGGENIDY